MVMTIPSRGLTKRQWSDDRAAGDGRRAKNHTQGNKSRSAYGKDKGDIGGNPLDYRHRDNKPQ